MDQIEFPSLAFPGRTMLYAHEVAAKLSCDVKHVYDLIEEGKLRAVNIAGGNNVTDRRFIRVPIEAWNAYVRENTL
jgi:excisionase family DNA binding protein